jgi:hypothetical protein
MKITGVTQLSMAAAIFVAMVYAGSQNNWALVGTLATGCFALLNSNHQPQQGDKSPN